MGKWWGVQLFDVVKNKTQFKDCTVQVSNFNSQGFESPGSNS